MLQTKNGSVQHINKCQNDSINHISTDIYMLSLIIWYHSCRLYCLFKGTLHSKLTLEFFSWPKSIYYCDLSLTNCTNYKGGGNKFVWQCWEIWQAPWYKLGNLKPVVISRNRWQTRFCSDSGVHSYGDYGIAAIKLVNKIKLNVSNNMYRNYLDYHTSV